MLDVTSKLEDAPSTGVEVIFGMCVESRIGGR